MAVYSTAEAGTVWCKVVRCGTVLCDRVMCGVVWCGAVFCGPWCWVWRVKYSSFRWLCLLIIVFLVVQLIRILFGKGLFQQVL